MSVDAAAGQRMQPIIRVHAADDSIAPIATVWASRSDVGKVMRAHTGAGYSRARLLSTELPELVVDRGDNGV